MQWEYLKDASDIRSYIDSVNAMDRHIALDIETTGLDPHTDKTIAIVLATEQKAVMFDAKHFALLDNLTPLLVLHNYKFDFNFLYRLGLDLRGKKVRDTMLMHSLLDENASHSLGNIVKEEYKDDYKKQFWDKHKKFEDASEDEQLAYACKDAIYTAKLFVLFDRRLAGDGGRLVNHVHRLAAALYDTELKGVKIDMPYLIQIGQDLKAECCSILHNMRQAVATQVDLVELEMWTKEIDKRKTDKGKARVPRPTFNFDSQKQVVNLFKMLSIPVPANKAGNPTVDSATLDTLKDVHPIVPQLQSYRKNRKLYTAFVESILEKQVGGRIYPSFRVNGTVTGRISSSNPNMQQLPRNGPIRGVYIPDAGYSLLTCDYQQLEVCLAAHFSNDPILIDLIKKGQSMHDYTAAALDIPRQLAKTINFLTIYGGSEWKLAHVMGIPVPHAKQLLDRLWLTYEGLREAIQECHRKVGEGTPIVNPFGRSRRFPTRFESIRDADRAKRQAFNALVQGTGADITHQAFYEIKEKIEGLGIGQALFEVHDEIVVQAKHGSEEAVAQVMQNIMVYVGHKIGLKVPLNVDCSKPSERWSK